MDIYKLDTGLWQTKEQKFSSEKEAWETLRKLLPKKWAGLYKKTKRGRILNYNKTKERFESKYTLQKIEDVLCQWELVLYGSTSSGYDYDE